MLRAGIISGMVFSTGRSRAVRCLSAATAFVTLSFIPMTAVLTTDRPMFNAVLHSPLKERHFR